MATYECSRGHTKVRKWLAKFAAGLNFYANVMDMLVQQHPEYVALAWGAMKVLIVVSKISLSRMACSFVSLDTDF